MTQHYLAGELSLLLGQLQATIADGASVVEIAHLRERAEMGSPPSLASVVVLALKIADRLCSDSLARGDAAAFSRQAALGAELWEFGVCADLLEER